MNSLNNQIHQLCPSDHYEVGFAYLSGLLTADLSKYNYGISLARKLDDSVINAITQGPTVEYYNLYHQINRELNYKTQKISTLFRDNNIEAYPVEATVDDSELDDAYRKTLAYSVSHKMVATRAGLGWIGKTDLLVTHRFGPRVRLASVLVTSEIFDSGKPEIESQCGNCTICVDSCPAHTATGQSWTTEVFRNEFYNPFKCRDYCRKISAEKINKHISLCGICLSVCPKGK